MLHSMPDNKKPPIKEALLNRLTGNASAVYSECANTKCVHDKPIKPHFAIASVNSCELMDIRRSQFRIGERKLLHEIGQHRVLTGSRTGTIGMGTLST